MGQAFTGLTAELGYKRKDDPNSYYKAWRELNKEKSNEYHRNYYHSKIKTDPTKHQAKLQSGVWTRRKKKYGISKTEYFALLEKQNGHCYVCNKEDGPNLRVDHDHQTGKVRKLLCNNCNTALGLMGEEPARLRAAANYLEQHTS